MLLVSLDSTMADTRQLGFHIVIYGVLFTKDVACTKRDNDRCCGSEMECVVYVFSEARV